MAGLTDREKDFLSQVALQARDSYESGRWRPKDAHTGKTSSASKNRGSIHNLPHLQDETFPEADGLFHGAFRTCVTLRSGWVVKWAYRVPDAMEAEWLFYCAVRDHMPEYIKYLPETHRIAPATYIQRRHDSVSQQGGPREYDFREHVNKPARKLGVPDTHDGNFSWNGEHVIFIDFGLGYESTVRRIAEIRGCDRREVYDEIDALAAQG